MVQSILVPLDGSVFAEQALPLAASIACKAGATLRLLRLMPPLEDKLFWAPLPGTAIESDLRGQKRAEVQAYLDGVVTDLKDIIASAVICEILDERDDGISESICADVVKTGADLIVLSSHGRGAAARFWLGSIADELVRTAPVPVLLVRPPENASKPDFHQLVNLKHILLALGEDTTAEQILGLASSIGKAQGVEYTLVHIVQPPVQPFFAPSDIGIVQEPSMDLIETRITVEQMSRHAEKYLSVEADRLRAGGAKVQISLPLSEEPAAAILREAARVGADLIALETHGRGASRVLMGSVADKVVRGSHIPVLLCRVPRDVS
ncbi:MAG TPA: universal stress protein [Gemmataceae bacterium]|jgi:nucleotide-binding universal stress UspA family protein|nr:universal stress protein [Gemmataceae bacterium]